MEILTSAILGGIIWDGIKMYGALTVDHLKNSLKKWSVKETDCEAVVKIINEIEEHYKKTEKFVVAIVDDNEQICKIIDDINLNNNNRTVVNQTITDNHGYVIGNVEGDFKISKEQEVEKKL